MVDGFIEREIGKLIRRYVKADTVFLEVGCGDTSLRKFLPPNVIYNAIDLELTDFHILNAICDKNVNLACASATDLPVQDNCVTLMVAAEVLEHIPNVLEVIKEMYRVATSGAVLVGSIPNNYCYKYDCKGKNKQHINEWGWEDFVSFMHDGGFDLISGHMLGKWIKFPSWVTTNSYHLPISSSEEYYNTHFVFAFRVRK